MLAALLTGLAVAAAVDGGPARPTDASADAAVSGAVVAHADEHDHDAPEAAPDDGDDEPGPDDRDDESGPNDRDDDGGLEDGDGERDDQRVRERRRKRTRIPRLPLANDVLPVANDWSPVLVDGAVGCALGGALPAVGATGGLGLFYGSLLGAPACGTAAGLVGGVSGALIAVPSLLLLGPCAGGGAACGAALGAVTADMDPWQALQWSLPGVVAGSLGGGVAAAGVLLSSASNRDNEAWAMPVGTTLTVVGALLAAAGGPLAVAGATLTQTPDDDDDEDKGHGRRRPKKALRDGGVEAGHAPAPAGPAGAMTF